MRQPDAAARKHILLGEPDRQPDAVDDPRGRRRRGGGVRYVVQKKGELVAAEPGQCGRPISGAPPQPVCHFDEQAVAGLLAKAVVQQLEPVEIDQQDRASVTARLAVRIERLRQAREQEAAAAQPGQRIMVGVEQQLRLRPLPLRDRLLERLGMLADLRQQRLLPVLERPQVLHVGGRTDPSDDPAHVVADRSGQRAMPEIGAVGVAPHPKLDIQDAGFARQPPGLQHGGPIVWLHDVKPAAPPALLLGLSGELEPLPARPGPVFRS